MRRHLPLVVVLAWTCLLATFVIVGADCLWAVALGDDVLRTGHLTVGVPFASSDTSGWPNPLVLGEVLLASVHRIGPAALVAFQLVVVAVTLGVTAQEARRRGARSLTTAGIVSLVVVGSLASLVITRLPSLSLVPFVAICAIVRLDRDRDWDRDREQSVAGGQGAVRGKHSNHVVWWAVPLLAVWANLHGGVLIGAAMLCAYLLLDRLRRRLLETLLVGLAALAALCATPALARSVGYYRGVFGNEAARRGTDLWAAPSLGNPLDLLMILAILVLVLLVVRRARQARQARQGRAWAAIAVWEVVAALGLLAATISAARNGTWLLLFLAPLAGAASGPTTADESTAYERDRTGLRTPSRRAVPVVAVVVAAALAGGLLHARDHAVHPPGTGQVAAIGRLAAGAPVLAVEPLAETLAAGGVRVWASNPLDAFDQPVQAAFLDFASHGTLSEQLMGDVRLVVVGVDTVQSRAMDATHGWSRGPDIGSYAVYARR